MPIKRVPFLEPGTFRLPNGRTVKHTPASIRKLVDRGNQLLAAGLRVPLCWMHDPEAEAQYMSHGVSAPHADAWKARHWFGEARRFVYEPATGKGVAIADIPSHRDAAKFQAVGQVSPGIYTDWIDEKNVLWPGQSLLHIASTPQPVARHLERVSDAHPQLFSHPVRAKDAYWLSLPADIRSTDMADEKDDDFGGDDSGSDSAAMQSIIDSLKKLDIHGLDVDTITDLKTLDIALKAAAHTKVGDTGEEPDGDEGMGGEGDGDGDEATEPVGAPVLMSQTLVSGLLKKVGDLEHKAKKAEVDALLADGKVTKDIHKKLTDELNRQFMSQPALADLEADGTRKQTALDIKIATYADLPKGKFADRQFMSQPAGTRVIPNPTANAEDGKPENKFEEWKKNELAAALARAGHQ